MPQKASPYMITRRAEFALASLDETKQKSVRKYLQRAAAAWPNLPQAMKPLKRKTSDGIPFQIASAGKDLRVFFTFNTEQKQVVVEDIAPEQLLRDRFASKN